MRFLAQLLILISLFGVNFAAIHAVTHESDAPFIYYYGYDGIVIERADGTHRRVLGEGMNLWPLRYLQWSSTGRWIAWDNFDLDVYGDIAVDPITISAARYDGEKQFTIDVEPSYIDPYWRWSPTEDWLLITQSSHYDGIQADIKVIDVETSEILLELEDFDGIPQWASDGHSLEHRRYAEPLLPTDSAQIERFEITRTISLDGSIQETSVPVQPYLSLPNDNYIYWDTTQASYFINGQDYGTPVQVVTPRDLRIQRLYLNNAQNTALVYTLEPVPDSDILYEQSFYLLSLADHTLRFIDTFRVSPLESELTNSTSAIYRAIWSPTDDAILIYADDGYPTNLNQYTFSDSSDGSQFSLYLVSLSPASVDLITDNPMALRYGGEHGAPTPIHLDWVYWTPDGSRFLFATEDKELAWYKVRTHQMIPTNLPAHSDIYGHRISLPKYGLNWSDDGERAILTWLHDSWLYDATTDTISDEPLSQHSLAYISPDGEFAVSLVACHSRLFHRDGPALGNCLINLETGERTDLVETDGIMRGGGGFQG